MGDGGPREAMPVVVFDGTGTEVATGASGAVDITNSTETALGAGQTFTGEWTLDNYGHIASSFYADQDGTFFIDISVDGGATTTFSRKYDVQGGEAGRFDAFVKGSRWHRVRFINGATPQSVLKVRTFTGNHLYPFAKSERDDPVYAALGFTDISATEYFGLVDLSDTVNFPHKDRGRADIFSAYFQADRNSTATGSVRIGVITRINGTDADVAFILGIRFDNSDTRRVLRDRQFPAPIKCGQSGGVLTKAMGSITTGIAAINTGVTLTGPQGRTFTPAVGDLIVALERTAGTYSGSVSIQYAGNVSTT